jgi:rare lipoprotein A
VAGQRYTVLNSSRDYLERGVASWYGPNFHGERTSVGEPYNMYAMTAAHRTLPLPAYARVTNLKNGRSVVVRLNDRGPFKANRIIDLSYTAALKLDMIREGTALVELRVLSASSNAPPPPPMAPLYAQVGAFTVESNAQRVLERLSRQGIQPAFIQHTHLDTRDLFRVRIGPIDSVERFDGLVNQLHDMGLPTVSLAPN